MFDAKGWNVIDGSEVPLRGRDASEIELDAERKSCNVYVAFGEVIRKLAGEWVVTGTTAEEDSCR